jgi:pyruvate kinase
MSVARLNFSHGTHEGHRSLAESLRRVAARLGAPVAVLQDLQGHKVRAGALDAASQAAGHLRLDPGREILVGHGDLIAPERIGLDYKEIAAHVEPGHRLFLDDGLIELRFTGRRGSDLVATVEVGGELRSRKGAIFPDSSLAFPLLDPRDLEDARFGVSLGCDMLAMSFVRSAAEIVAMRRQLSEWGEPRAFIVAKIEDPEGLRNLDGILDAADAVLIARGDLGVTLPRERVPGVQKEIIRKANARGVAVITATQMLETMTSATKPTRAEVNDVYNAVADGTDAVMLSGETASGRHPVLAVREMERICRAAAEELLHGAPLVPEREARAGPEGAGGGLHREVAGAAAHMARGTKARCILGFSLSGATLRALSAARPSVPVYGVVPDERIERRLQLHWGLSIITLPRLDSLRALAERAFAILAEAGVVKGRDRVVVVAGAKQPSGADSPFLRIHVV